MTGHVAHLRVYEPLAAFPEDERGWWSSYAAAGRAPGRSRGAALERAAVLRALARRPPGLADDPGEAWVTEVDGVTLVCPWRTALRAGEALAEWQGTLHEDLADAFLPRAVVQAEVERTQEWQQAHPGRRSHVRSSRWSVPLRWFVLVEADERNVSLGAGAERSRSLGEGTVRTGRELLYRTAMSRARRRTARALAVLRRTLDDGGEAVDGLEDLGRWLEEFHPRSLVELDYGGLVHLVDDAGLVADESARDVSEALAALAEGEGERAAAAYGRVKARMKALEAVESAG